MGVHQIAVLMCFQNKDAVQVS
uniref:Transposase n=1 Tax=Heterorhabditis bacteriophora TaxID=37862 RepID=A0A1I7XAQ3_HETBA